MQKEKIHQFLNSHTASILIIKGMAGTGKTTNLSSTIDYLNSESRSYAVLAPTGTAAKILKSRLGEKRYTLPQTIHAFLYEKAITQIENESEQMLTFSLRDNTQLADDLVVIIDEASMISHKTQTENYLQFGSGNLLRDLLSYLDLENSNRQLILIGDNYQLPPVNVNESIVLQADELQNHIRKPIEQIQLETVYRQNTDSYLYKTLMQLRDGLRENAYSIVPIKADYDTVQAIEEDDALKQYLWADEKSAKKAMYIAFSNEDVHKINLKFRAMMDYKNAEIEYGERLMIMKNCYVDNVRLYNGDFVKVEKIGKQECRIIRVPIEGGYKEVELCFRDVLLAYYNESFVPATIRCKLLENRLWHSKLYDDDEEKLERQALIIDFQKRHKDLKKKTKEYAEAFINDSYVNALYTRFGYAITCHKAQGGEWDEVYIKMNNDYLNLNCENGFRWAYTAMSRAKKKVYLIGHKEQIQQPVQHLKQTITNVFNEHSIKINHEKDIQYGIQYELIKNNLIGRIKIYFNGKFVISSVQCIDNNETAKCAQTVLEHLVKQSIHHI